MFMYRDITVIRDQVHDFEAHRKANYILAILRKYKHYR